MIGESGEVSLLYWMGDAPLALGRAKVWLDGEEEDFHYLFGDYLGASEGNRLGRFYSLLVLQGLVRTALIGLLWVEHAQLRRISRLVEPWGIEN